MPKPSLNNYTLLLALLFILGCQSAKNDSYEATIHQLQTELEAKKDSITTLQALFIVDEEKDLSLKNADIDPQPIQAYKLYQSPIIQEINNSEFAEVISSMDTVATFRADEFSITAVSVCNGPADPDLDYCNCSNFIYVVTATDGEYSDYRLFKIGPFYLPEFKGWKQDRGSPELRIEHDVKGKKKVHTYRISETSIKQI